MLLHTTSFARAGLVGNPSDGYYGKTVAFSFEDFGATVTMYETPEVQILPAAVDDALFPDLDALVKDVGLYGYYGGLRLLKATAKVFAVHCREHGIGLPKRNFTVRYRSNIPRLVGLGGSSAICTAMFKGLMRFYEVEIAPPVAASLCWRAENAELGITCGLQDRVVQLYDGLVYMDFDRELFERQGYGRYEYIPVKSGFPPLYLAYDPNRAEISGVYHRRLRVLFEEKNRDIVSAMSEFADLAQQAYEALTGGRFEKLPALIDANFDLRHRVFNVAEENVRMVEQARSVGASAKFAGSGGAIVGTYEDEAMYRVLGEALGRIGCRLLKPRLAPPAGAPPP
ncbi:MAG: GHMP kinase [Kiritimatiellaeota bacterium]|nr:GHMP kinase [Kiritimatiellota bacterium]